MTIVSNSIIYNKYLRLLPETVEWLKQQSDIGKTINELVADTRKCEEYNLKQRTRANLADAQKIYFLNEEIKNLQKQFLKERYKSEKLYQQMQDEKDKVSEQLEISQEQIKTLQKQLPDNLNW